MSLSNKKDCIKEWTFDECDYHKHFYHEDDVRKAVKELKGKSRVASDKYLLMFNKSEGLQWLKK